MSLFPNTSRFWLKGLGFGLYILSSISSPATPSPAVQAHWHDAASADIFWKEVIHGLDPRTLNQAQRRKAQIESYLEQRQRRKDDPRDQISYHIYEVVIKVLPAPDYLPRISFQLPLKNFPQDPIPCAVRILRSEDLWSRPWGSPTSDPTSDPAPFRIDLPNRFLLLNGNPNSGQQHAEYINISAFTDKQGFLSIVFIPILSADGSSWTNTQILIIRTRIRRLWETAEKFLQEAQVLEMADQGPHSDYLAVLMALRDSQRGSNPPDLRPLIGENLLQDFNAQHPGTEEIKLVYQLRGQLQLPRLQNLMTEYRDHLQAYLAKLDPGLQDIEELRKAVDSFIPPDQDGEEKQNLDPVKHCMIKTDIFRRYLENLDTRVTRGGGNFYRSMGPQSQTDYRKRFEPYISNESKDHQISDEEWKALAQILKRSILVLDNFEESNLGKILFIKGNFFSPEGNIEAVTISDTPEEKENAQAYLGDPSVIKIYRREPGHAGAILSAPPQP
jgi:hypothetical protein